MTVEIIEDPGNRQVFVQMDELEDRTRRGIRQFWFKQGKSLLKEFNRAVLEKPRSGRVYRIRGKGGRSRRHIASQAGESPANRSGNYRKSAGYQIRGTQEMEFGAGAKYAGWLENGVPEDSGSRMAARPGLGNAVRNTEGEALRDASNSVERELTKR